MLNSVQGEGNPSFGAGREMTSSRGRVSVVLRNHEPSLLYTDLSIPNLPFTESSVLVRRPKKIGLYNRDTRRNNMLRTLFPSLLEVFMKGPEQVTQLRNDPSSNHCSAILKQGSLGLK